MRIPEKLICDLCEQPIADGTPHAHVTIPMTPAQFERLLVANRAVASPAPQGILNLADLAVHALPRQIVLECHAECITGIAPIFQTAAGRVLEAVIAAGLERHERRRAALEGREA